MNPDSTLAVTNTCPKDGVHLCCRRQLALGQPARGAPRRVELVDRVRRGSFEKFDKYKKA